MSTLPPDRSFWSLPRHTVLACALLTPACDSASSPSASGTDASALPPVGDAAPAATSQPMQDSDASAPQPGEEDAATDPEHDASVHLVDAATSEAPPTDAAAASPGDAGPDIVTGMPNDAMARPVESGVDAGPGTEQAEAGADPCPAVPEFVEPTRLSETGLYSDTAAGTLAPGVFEYSPQYELWTDGAVKRRFVYLPPCTQIDTSDMDYWTYPTGTKLWKEFVRNNQAGDPIRVETRLIQKTTQTKWFMTSFIWNDENSDALVEPEDGDDSFVLVENAKGTPHDVPGRGACVECHDGMWDKVLGFSALQLSHDVESDWMSLERLVAEDWLSEPPTAPLALPGTDAQQDAVGYLHANCGHCHNQNSKQANLGMYLWATSDALSSVETTSAYVTNVGLETQSFASPVGEPALRVVAGAPEESAVVFRMVEPPVFPSSPRGGVHMPLIGTEVTDERGLQLVIDWINSLQ